MIHIITGYVILLTYVALIFAFTALAKHVIHAPEEVSRKVAHIMFGGVWMLLWAVFWGEQIYLITAFVAVIVAVIGVKLDVFAVTSRADSKEDDVSIVFFTLGELVLACMAYFYPPALPAGTCGMMSVAFGDGFAALVGKKWGKYTPKLCGQKSLAGSMGCFLFAMLSMIIACKIMGFNLVIWKCAVLALVAAGVELVSNKYDNLVISVSVAVVGVLIHVAA